jgi:hypothetical protein
MAAGSGRTFLRKTSPEKAMLTKYVALRSGRFCFVRSEHGDVI